MSKKHSIVREFLNLDRKTILYHHHIYDKWIQKWTFLFSTKRKTSLLQNASLLKACPTWTASLKPVFNPEINLKLAKLCWRNVLVVPYSQQPKSLINKRASGNYFPDCWGMASRFLIIWPTPDTDCWDMASRFSIIWANSRYWLLRHGF